LQRQVSAEEKMNTTTTIRLPLFVVLSFGFILAASHVRAEAPLPTAGLDPNQRAIAGNINSHQVSFIYPFPPFFPITYLTNDRAIALAEAIYALPAGDEVSALNQLSPEEFGRFTSITAFNNATFETEAMDNYLAGRRDTNGDFFGSNGKIDVNGLTINDPNYDPALAQVHSRLMAFNPAPDQGTISDVANPMLGGTDSKDMKDTKSVAGPEYTNPFSLFVRGNVILGQGLSQADVGHFDDNTESVTVGVDYRITPHILVGLTAAYGHTDVTLDSTTGSSATVDSYSPGFYASYADKGWYANLTGDYVHNAYTQQRNISFLGETANSAPEGNEGVANIDGGYDFHHGALTFGPLAGLQYTHLSVDGYDESGAALADLSVNGQDTDSLRSRLGGRVSYAFSECGLSIRPHLDATWQHEFLDQARGITSSFEGSGLGSFSVRTETPERDFALADAGVDIDVNQTVTVFADYAAQAGQSNYFGQSVQAGVRFGF
jgi:uncharacterized protein YhjY with autotransporter beta-barrel domain